MAVVLSFLLAFLGNGVISEFENDILNYSKILENAKTVQLNCVNYQILNNDTVSTTEYQIQQTDNYYVIQEPQRQIIFDLKNGLILKVDHSAEFVILKEVPLKELKKQQEAANPSSFVNSYIELVEEVDKLYLGEIKRYTLKFKNGHQLNRVHYNFRNELVSKVDMMMNSAQGEMSNVVLIDTELDQSIRFNKEKQLLTNFRKSRLDKIPENIANYEFINYLN